MSVTVEISGAHKRYGGVRVLRGLDASFRGGELVALLGLNGSGKTTLLRAFAGLAGLDRGSVALDGEDLRRDSVAMRRKFCLLPDFPVLFEGETVTSQIAIQLKLWECGSPAAEERAACWLERFDLLPLARTSVTQLSRGQRYKVALTALAAVDPPLWLLDEPFASGMDPRGIEAFRALARGAAQRGRLVIFSTQIAELAERFAGRVCLLEDGVFRLDGPVEELRGGRDAGWLGGYFGADHDLPP
jgi:ABC-type multidrug transport system ATPase subunit